MTEPTPEATLTDPPRFRIPVMALVGELTSDNRLFEALTWREPPLPLMWQRQDAHGEMPGPTVQVGIIDSVALDGATVSGEGVFLANCVDALDLVILVEQQGRSGVSVDASATEKYIEIGTDEDLLREMADEESTGELHIEQERERYPIATIMGATCVAFPAFEGAYLELADAPVAAEAAPPPAQQAASVHVLNDPADLEALVASVAPLAPPAEWFADPELDGVTHMTIEDSGRIYGHLADWGSEHIGFPDQSVKPPRPSDESLSWFNRGVIVTAEGRQVSVGKLTMKTGHASTDSRLAPAIEHYDNTGAVAATVRAGVDAHGIWLAGAIEPDLDELSLRRLRAADVSGDWRSVSGRLELIAALACNTPGFPIRRPSMLVASGRPVSLVAAGMVRGHRPADPRVASAIQRAMEPVYDSVRRGYLSRIRGR